MNKEPKVSVIMAAFNAEKFIGNAIDSVIRQSYRNFELLIVDDCSSDATLRVAKSYSDDRVKVFSNEVNSGPSFARNFAIRQAAGVYATIIDADDCYHPDRLRVLVDKMNSGADIFVADDSILFVNIDDVGSHGSVLLQQRIVFDTTGESQQSLRSFFMSGTPNIKPMFPLSMVRERGILYDEQIWFGEDLKFVIDLFCSGLKLKLLDSKTYFYRMNPFAITKSTRKPWDQLAGVHLYASKKFQEQNDRVSEAVARNSFLKYSGFDKIKKRDFFGLLKMLAANPKAFLVLYEGIKETIIFRLQR